MILCIIYGMTPAEVRERRHEIVDYIEEFVRRDAEAAAPGKNMVDIFPSLLSLPDCIAPWKRKAKQCFETDTQFFTNMLSEALAREVRRKYCSVRTVSLIPSIGVWHSQSKLLCRYH